VSDGLQIKQDVITVIPATHDPDGHALEPELAPAVRSIVVATPLSLNNGRIIRPDMPGSFDYETTAGEIAYAMKARCATCKHFNTARWRQLRRELDWGNMEQRAFVNEIRASIEQTLPVSERDKHIDDQGEIDLEHALDSFGLCEAATEIWSREKHEMFPVLQLPTGGCPQTKTPSGTNLANLYQPRDRSADRAASDAYDKILGMARGKRPE